MESIESTYGQVKRQTASAVPENENHPLYRAVDACWLKQHLPDRVNDPMEHYAEQQIRTYWAEHPERAGQPVVRTLFYMMDEGAQADVTIRIELIPDAHGRLRRHGLHILGTAPSDRLARVRLDAALVLESNVTAR